MYLSVQEVGNPNLHPINDYRPSFLIKHAVYNLLDYLRIKSIEDNVDLEIVCDTSLPKELVNLYLPGFKTFDQVAGDLDSNEKQQVVKIPGDIIPNQGNWEIIKSIVNSRSQNLVNLVKDLSRVQYSFDILSNFNFLLEEHLELYLKHNMKDLYEILPQVYVKDRSIEYNKLDLDGSEGLIILGKEVKLGSFSVLKGPLWIDDFTEIKPLSHLYNASVGIGCKLGGEIASSLIYDYTNKSHFGFMGNSLVGSWVNIGAGTTTSNLKNNYQPIEVNYHNRKVSSDMIFMGAMLGDFAKTSVNTSLYPGVQLGLGAIASGLVKNNIPIFHYKTDIEFKKLQLEKFIDTTRIMFSRRNIESNQLDMEVSLLETIYQKRILN